jgi:hypothetical protein
MRGKSLVKSVVKQEEESFGNIYGYVRRTWASPWKLDSQLEYRTGTGYCSTVEHSTVGLGWLYHSLAGYR